MKPPSGCRAYETRRVCPSSGSGVVAPAEADRCPLSALAATGPTAGPAALRKPPGSAHRRLHFPGSLSPSPRPSPGSSACTLCRLMNGPSWHRQVDPVHQSPQTRRYGFFTHGTVPPSRLYSSGSLSLPDHLRRLPSPTQFRRRLPGHVAFTTLHRYYSAVRLLTERRSPLRFRL